MLSHTRLLARVFGRCHSNRGASSEQQTDGGLRLVGYQEVAGVCSVELCQQLMECLRQRHLAEERTQDVIQGNPGRGSSVCT